MGRYLSAGELQDIANLVQALDAIATYNVGFGGSLTVWDTAGERAGDLANPEGNFYFYLDGVPVAEEIET